MYADTITNSMQAAIEETKRRREVQLAYNKEHGVSPQTVAKEVRETVRSQELAVAEPTGPSYGSHDVVDLENLPLVIDSMEKEMKMLAKNMQFERAAEVRDEIAKLRKIIGVAEAGNVTGSKRKVRRFGVQAG
jgi:excinuclease ABC subunit B